MTVFDAMEWLEAGHNPGYGKLPIPVVTDDRIGALLTAWMALDAPQRQTEAALLVPAHRPTLLAYSERMATLSVRNRDEKLILLGLVALGIDGWRGDWRDSATVMPLHYDAALRIGVSPAAVFGSAASLLAKLPAEALRSFLGRSDTDKSLAAMGYGAGTDDDGFRYLRNW